MANELFKVIDFFEDSGMSIKRTDDPELTNEQHAKMKEYFEKFSLQKINNLLEEVEKMQPFINEFERVAGIMASSVKALEDNNFIPETAKRPDSNKKFKYPVIVSMLDKRVALCKRCPDGIQPPKPGFPPPTEPLIEIARKMKSIEGIQQQVRDAVNKFTFNDKLYGNREREWKPAHSKCGSILCASDFIDREFNKDDNTYSLFPPHTGIYGLSWLLVKHFYQFKNDFDKLPKLAGAALPYKIESPSDDGGVTGPDPFNGTTGLLDGETKEYIYFKVTKYDTPDQDGKVGTYGLTKKGAIFEKMLRYLVYMDRELDLDRLGGKGGGRGRGEAPRSEKDLRILPTIYKTFDNTPIKVPGEDDYPNVDKTSREALLRSVIKALQRFVDPRFGGGTGMLDDGR